ncbi:MAG: thiamine pyrophosphate-dependent enzyme [Pseudomonadota bacterium]
MNNRILMLGNQAISRGLIENGCVIATSYPGTPASEILPSLVEWQQAENTRLHAQWSINEKVAFEIAYTAGIAGLRSMVSMKQVGLNVASDPLMSAAYMGTVGGFLIVCADDPGPHSSQTEQDSRMMAMMAKIPVLDPDSPAQAKDMIAMGYALSEAFETPVMIRPTTRVCHSRQDVAVSPVVSDDRKPVFEKNPARWAATPKFRFRLHQSLEQKLSGIAGYAPTAPLRCNPDAAGTRAIVVSGVAAAHTRDVLKDLGLWDRIPLYQVLQPFPLHREFVDHLETAFSEILVIEESTGVIEMQIADRHKVRGKASGTVPSVGEILPETIEVIVAEFAGKTLSRPELPAAVPGRRPTLCAGCPHRASFFAIKKAAPRGIYTSDIGCYTLGLNLGAVDTFICMGAAISQAAGFYQAFRNEPKRPDIVATLGDSTFFHAGIPALIDTVVQNVRFVLVILDNRTTAMTGNQPTPSSGRGIGGEPTITVEIEKLVQGCGIQFCKTGDPYDVPGFISLVKSAVDYSRETGPAVIIARRPCLLDRNNTESRPPFIRVQIVQEDCDACHYCIQHFECPALITDGKDQPVRIDPAMCTGCGVCLHVCPKKAIKIMGDGEIK